MSSGLFATPTPTALGIPQSDGSGFIDTGWLHASVTPTPNDLVLSDGSGHIDPNWLIRGNFSSPNIFQQTDGTGAVLGTGIALTLSTQVQKSVWAGPISGANASPTFRLLASTDIPDLSTIYQPLNTHLTNFGALSDGTGWLHNNGAGIFAYSAPTKADIGLSLVENTALSTWAGLLRAQITSRNYDKIVRVTSTITAALAAITDNSVYNKYLVFIPNGIYNEDNLSTLPYVDLVGESRSGVIIQSSSGTHDTILLQDNAMVANLTVTHTNNTGDAGVYQYAIHADYPPANTTPVPATATKNSTAILYNLNAQTFGTNSKSGIGIGLYPNQRLYIVDCLCSSSVREGIFAHNQAGSLLAMNLNIINTTCNGVLYGFRYSNVGSLSGGDIVRIIGGAFSASAGTDILVDNTTGAGETFIAIDPTAKYTTSSFVAPAKVLSGLSNADLPIEASTRFTPPCGPIHQAQTGETNLFASPTTFTDFIFIFDATDSTSLATGCGIFDGGISVVKSIKCGTGITINPLFAPTRLAEVHIPFAVNSENYFRAAASAGSTYGAEYGFSIDSVGNPYISINRINAGSVVSVLKVDAISGSGVYSGNLSVSGKLAALNQIAVSGTTNPQLRADMTSGASIKFQALSGSGYCATETNHPLVLAVNNTPVLTLGTDTSSLFAGPIITAAPSGGTARPIKFGAIVTAASVLDTTRYAQAEINGVVCKLALIV